MGVQFQQVMCNDGIIDNITKSGREPWQWRWQEGRHGIIMIGSSGWGHRRHDGKGFGARRPHRVDTYGSLVVGSGIGIWIQGQTTKQILGCHEQGVFLILVHLGEDIRFLDITIGFGCC